MKSYESSDWSEVREAYCNTAATVRDICVRFGITRAVLYRRIGKENWPKRSDAAKARNGGRLQNSKSDHHKISDMVSRLSGVFYKQLQEAEAAANAPGANATERERSGRALSVLWRNYEKLKEHEEMQFSDNKTTDSDQQTGWKSGEEERLRKELYERLSRMVRKRKSELAAKKNKTK